MSWFTGAGDFITPTIKMLRGLNYCIAIGPAAIAGQKVLNRAGITCAFDIDCDGGGCSLSVRKDDINQATDLLRRMEVL